MSKRKKGSKKPISSRHTSATDSSDEAGNPPPRAWLASLLQYRFLAVVLAIALPLAVYELSRDDLPKSTSEVRPEWLLPVENNLPRTLTSLYPNRSNGHLYRAYQASMCFESEYAPPVCKEFPQAGLQDVLSEWERTLGSGTKVQEDAIRNYAFVAYQMGDAEAAAGAVAYWRMNYPHSIKPDPRDLADAAIQGSP